MVLDYERQYWALQFYERTDLSTEFDEGQDDMLISMSEAKEEDSEQTGLCHLRPRRRFEVMMSAGMTRVYEPLKK